MQKWIPLWSSYILQSQKMRDWSQPIEFWFRQYRFDIALKLYICHHLTNVAIPTPLLPISPNRRNCNFFFLTAWARECHRSRDILFFFHFPLVNCCTVLWFDPYTRKRAQAEDNMRIGKHHMWIVRIRGKCWQMLKSLFQRYENDYCTDIEWTRTDLIWRACVCRMVCT